jgi:hypothetical protein
MQSNRVNSDKLIDLDLLVERLVAAEATSTKHTASALASTSAFASTSAITRMNVLVRMQDGQLRQINSAGKIRRRLWRHSYETCTKVFTIQQPVIIIRVMNEAANALTNMR